MKDDNQIFSTYKKRMTVSAIISSVCYGLIIGGGVAFISALVCWLLNYNVVWVAVGTGLGSAVIGGILLYFLKFRPSEYSVVRKMDTMGLEERTITMYGLRNTNTTVAELQRRDAREKIANVSSSQVKTAFPLYAAGKVVAVFIAAALILGIGMTVVTALTGSGIIDGPGIVDAEQDKFIDIVYKVDEGGEIQGGDEVQTISPGEDADPVVAVADDGWIFVRWSDGLETTERVDRNVKADLTVTAIFEEIEEGDGEDGDGALDNDNDGDYDENAPDPDKNDGAGGNGEAGEGGEGDGDGSTGEGTGTGEGGQPGEGQGDGQGDGAGGSWSDSNQIIDGETDYRDVFESYYDMAMEILNNSGNYPPELVEFIQGYFGSI